MKLNCGVTILRRASAILIYLLLFACAARGAPHKLRVNDPALARSLVARGGKVVADYGGFQLIQADDVLLTNLDEARVQRQDDFDEIKLNAKSLNTRAAAIVALRKSAGNFSGKHLHLVQFAGPVKPEWLADLENHGAHIVSYLPENAYLIYGDSNAIAKIQTWAGTNQFVQWEGAYADDYKIHPAARLTDVNGKPQQPLTDSFSIQMVDDPPANLATLTLIGQWQMAGAESEYTLLGYRNMVVRLPPDKLNLIAAQPDVVSIQPYFEPEKLDERQDIILTGNLTSSNTPNGPGYLAWLASKGFTQAQFTNSNFAVDVSDSGLDNGTTSPGHFGLYDFGDTNQPGRVAYNRLEGSANSGSTLRGDDGHGTLNSHIIAGYDDYASGFPHTDAAGYYYGLGVCPFVKIGSSVIFDPNSYTSPNFTTLQTQAYNSGARISNNSWGSNVNGAYDANAQTFDALVRDVGKAGLKRQMVIVFAAGNTPTGAGAGSIDSPASAKNVITVGAAENVRSLSIVNGGSDSAGDSGCTSDPDSDANSANDIANFSNRGPCADGREKPDIVAPGTHITGGVEQTSPSPSPAGDGLAISTFTASGVCGLIGYKTNKSDYFFPLGQQFYTVSTGTSHSTPAVSGACALLRQYFINNTNAPPSPAMTKAYLMNSARYLNGVNANDKLWSPNQGMGELNLGTAFDGTQRILRDQMSVENFTAAGQTHIYTGTVPDSTKPFRVTLAWTDAPGSTSASKELVNNLDLVVTAGTNSYKGNVFNGQYSTNGGAADGTNNVESVFLPAGKATNFNVTITAAQVSADAITNSGTLPEQDYALVIYNGAIAIPTAQNISVSNSLVTLQWNVNANFNYTVQFKNNLTDPNWTDAVTNTLATNTVFTVTDSPGTSQRFYRISAAQ
jgi:hypothetical protein